MNGTYNGAYVILYGTSLERLAIPLADVKPDCEFYENDTGAYYKWLGVWTPWSTQTGPSPVLGSISTNTVRDSTATFTPAAGQTITAGQWFADGVAISGQTTLTTPRNAATLGKRLSFRPASSTFTADGGVTTPKVPGAPTSPTIVAQPGGLLIGATAPADDGGSPIIGYRITISSMPLQPFIVNSTVLPFLCVPVAAGIAATAVLEALNSIGYGAASAASASVAPAAPYTAPTVTTNPVIASPVTAGQTASATAGTYAGNPAPTVTRRWYSNGVLVATGATYAVPLGNANQVLTVKETATNIIDSVVATSAGVSVTAAGAGNAPAVLTPVAITGTPQQGIPLAITAATFSGTPTPTITRVIYMDGVQVASGNNTTTYTPLVADYGKIPSVTDTATNTAGTAFSTGTAAAVIATPATYSRIKSAVLSVAGGTGYAKIAPVGDSTTTGYGSGLPGSALANGRPISPTAFLKAALASAQALPVIANSWVGDGGCSNNGTTLFAYDPRLTLPDGAGWANSITSALTAGCRHEVNSSNTTRMAFLPTDGSCDTFEITTPVNTTLGSLNVARTGMSNATINQSGTANIAKNVYTSTLSSTNPLYINRIAGLGYVMGVDAWDSTVKSIRLQGVGWNAGKTSDWIDSATAFNPFPALKAIGAHLYVVRPGINEWLNSVPVATFKANLETLIDGLLTVGDVLMCTPYPSQITTTPLATQQLYVDVILSVAAARGLQVENTFAKWGSWEAANALGYMGDSLHPNQTGYQSAATDCAAKIVSITATTPVTVPAFKGSVASNTFVPDALVTANTRLGSRSPHKMSANASQIRIVVPAWTVQTNVETNATADITVSAALEYPAGTYTQITFGASTTGTITAGLELESDLVAAPPKGAKFWVRMLQLCPGGALAFKYCAYDGTGKLSGGTTTGTVPDYVMGGGEWGATTAGTVGFMAMPCAIIADATTTPAVGIGGDSISVGTNDLNDGSRAPLQGQLARAFGTLYPTGHFGVYGDNLNAYIASHTKRIRISQYYSHFVYNMGINDIPSRSAAQVQADSNTVTGYHPAGKVAWCTLSPVTTSSDNWVTVANQGIASAPKEAARVAINPQRLTNFPLAATVYDVNPTIENIASPEDGKFSVVGGSNTSDGTHWNTNSCSRVAPTINPALLVF